MAVYFLQFTAINANPISFATFDFPLTENRVKHKLAFKNPKTGSTSGYFHFMRGCPFCLLKNHRNNDMLTGTKDS